MTEDALEDLIAVVDGQAAGSVLDRLKAASDLAEHLRARAENLIDHYVSQARDSGASWSEIGEVLTVSKQAAHQRYGALTIPPPGTVPRQLTGPAKEAWLEGVRQARKMGHHYLAPEHLILGLLSQPEELGGRALAELGVSDAKVRPFVAQRLGGSAPRPTGSLGVSPQTKRLLELAHTYARRLGHKCARTEHILLAATAPKLQSPALGLLTQCGAPPDRVRNQLAEMLSLEAPELAKAISGARARRLTFSIR